MEIIAKITIDNESVNVDEIKDLILSLATTHGLSSIEFVEEKEEKPNALDTFISLWIDLWPDQQRLERYGVGDKVIIDRSQITKKMKTFIKDYKKNTGEVLPLEQKLSKIYEATIRYLSLFASGKTEWVYLMKAANFISHREKGSELLGQMAKGAAQVYNVPNIHFRMG